jgi:hypothetical protein
MAEHAPLPCIVCRRELENLFPREVSTNQPNGACTFTSHGQYGSTVFDECDGSKLEINVCDDCLKSAQARNEVGYWPELPRRRLQIWAGE